MINLLKYMLLPPAIQALAVLFGLLLIWLGRRFFGGLSRVVLISQAWHLNRAVPVFEAQGLQVLPAPIQFATPPPEGLVSWMPTAYYFRQSSQALHERFGLLVYRWMERI